MQQLKNIINKCLGFVCALLLAFMSCLAVYQVVARYVFNNPSTISEDLLGFCFVWVSLLAAALVFGERDHMKLAYFEEKASPELRLCMSIFSQCLTFAMAVLVFLIGGSGFMNVGRMQMSPTLGISMDWIYMILPFSGVLILIYAIINAVELIQDYLKTGKGGAQ